MGYKAVSTKEIDGLKKWLIKKIFPDVVKRSEYTEHAYSYFREQRMEPFTSKELERHINSACSMFEAELFSSIHSELSDKTKLLMDDLLKGDDNAEDGQEVEFKHLKKDIPGAKLKHVSFEIKKMYRLKKLVHPEKLINTLSRKLVKKYYTRVLAEPPGDIERHPPDIRYATFSLFCYFRSELITDNLLDLLMQLTHKMQTAAENFVNKKIIAEVKRVNGKFDILYLLANTSILHPAGIIQEKIYPHVGKETLANLVNELSHKGKWYESQVHIKMRSLYSHGQRKSLLALIESFTFKTNLTDSKPLLKALDIIKQHRDSSDKYYPTSSAIPIKNVVPIEWHSMVIEAEMCDSSAGNNNIKINRINYEISVLQALRTQLRCKMIWVDGAYRYRDPDKDLPNDFDENREQYYQMMSLPLNVDDFIGPRKRLLHESLTVLNGDIPTNNKVRITDKDGGRIKISPYESQADPPNIKKLHRVIQQEWSTINLIDILKEVDLQVGFTNQFHTVASRKSLTKETLQRRLLLCLYAIGTNTGLKRISAANDDVTFYDLRYVKRRFINTVNAREAIIKIVNKILEVRDPRVWGEVTTGVACDSKKLSVWDQNLMAEWHARYRGRGVMVYWHVDKKSLCVYSQLKTCSSSEVGSMIKGILQHCTDMIIDQAYMDTHGQSTVGFGVSELLHFNLLPRLKNINKQKLYYPSPNHKNEYENITEILKTHINWKLIEDNYDETVKHMVALKTGMVDPDVFIKRFSKDNYQHPVYKTLVEIGKVSRTIFLCRYLMSEELRIEIHEMQNVVERLNSIMGFIFYGKLGEISTNLKEDQELAIVCLHLLQACMAYINTLIIQRVLVRPEWQNILTPEDKRAVNVLVHNHINPYGLFPLDLNKRLGISADDLKSEDEGDTMDNVREQKEEEFV